MECHKSHEEFVLGVLDALLVDCASYYPGLTREFRRDSLRLRSALKCHGIRFILETMPSFRKHFDKCLSDQRLTPSNLFHFGTGGKGGAIPRLFRGLTLRVFESSGVLRTDPDIQAVRLLRQLLGVVRKLELSCTVRDVGNAVTEFYQIDTEVRDGDLLWSSGSDFEAGRAHQLSFGELEELDLASEPFLTEAPSSKSGLYMTIQRVADLLSAHLGVFDPYSWKPKHGPGVVADHKFGTYKYVFDKWPDRLERVFPYADFAHANYAQVELVPRTEAESKGFYQDAPARLCAVPKTIKTPRLIAAEPLSYQWCQQTIKDYFYTRVGETIAGLFIDFRRQELNGSLALTASHTASHATIDLSSASDRISCWHVERLFRRLPCLLDALQATRSTSIRQDLCKYSPKLYSIRKYTTMGNATTFPVQSLFFATVALGCLLHSRGLKVTERNLKRLGRWQVRVFGDDIIVPKDCSGLVVETLTALGLRVNAGKTFLNGQFRESCGVDAFLGNDVTSTSILKTPQRSSPGSIVSSVDVHHNLLSAGYAATAHYLQKTASRLVSNKIRYVTHGSGLFGWSDLCGTTPTRTRTRWNVALHRTEVQCLRLRVKDTRRPAEEHYGLLQFFAEAPKKVTSAVSTLGFLSRRPQTKVGLGWVPAR